MGVAVLTPVLTLAVGLLTAGGVYLLLARKVFSAILGLSLLTHAVNLVMLAAGDAAQRAPIVTESVERKLLADPVPQALVLTAIVISMAVTLYLLATFVMGSRVLGIDETRPARASETEDEASSIQAGLPGDNRSRT